MLLKGKGDEKMAGDGFFRRFVERLRPGSDAAGKAGRGGEQDGRVSAQPVRLQAVPRAGRGAAGDVAALLPEVAARKAAISAARRDIIVLGVLGLSFASNVVLVIALNALSAGCEPTPIAVRVGDKNDQLLAFSPMVIQGDLRATLTEKLLREYVAAREVIDLATESERWRLIPLASTDELTRQFFGMMSKDNPNSPYQIYLKDKKRRAADVMSISRIGTSDVWQAEVRTYDIDQTNTVVSERYWLMTMTVVYEQKKVTFENRFVNPYGLTITAYSVAPRGM